MANLKIEGKQKRSKEGTNEAFKRRLSRNSNVSARADIGTATPAWLHAAICAVAQQGGAFRIGYTGDGGAIAIGVYMDGDVEKVYLTPKDSLDEYLEGLYHDFAGTGNATDDTGGN